MYVFMGCMLQFYPYKTHNLSYILYIGPLTSTFEQIATLRTKRTPKDQSSEYLEKANEREEPTVPWLMALCRDSSTDLRPYDPY